MSSAQDGSWTPWEVLAPSAAFGGAGQENRLNRGKETYLSVPVAVAESEG